MNLAFPTLLILLIVLPGIILRYVYRRGFAGRGQRVGPLTDEIVYSLVFALVLQTVWVRLVTGCGYRILLGPLLSLLLGPTGGDQGQITAAIRMASRHPYHVTGYFLGLYLFSAILGLAARGLVQRGGLDRRIFPLRFNDDTFYDWSGLITGDIFRFPQNRLLGVDPDRIAGVYLSTVVTQGDRTSLYRGIVRDWFLDRDGSLDRVILSGAHRRLLTEDRPTDFEGEDEARYYRIRGSYLVIRASEMQTLNFEYIMLDPPGPDELPDAAPALPSDPMIDI